VTLVLCVVLQGYCLFYESMLPSIIHCRDKWLKQVCIMTVKLKTLIKMRLLALANCSFMDI